jgi:hypothetical protein
MSDCGICLTSYDGGECTGYRCVTVHAGQKWECDECGCLIPKGSLYELASGFNEGSHWQTKTCLICAEIAEAFYCGGRWHGRLWDSMEDVITKLTTACFSRLQSPEAKAELRRRWMDVMLDPNNRDSLRQEFKENLRKAQIQHNMPLPGGLDG